MNDLFEIQNRMEIVKCPKCGNNINLSVGKVPGGVNDYGGWILQCNDCKCIFPYPVKNPNDYSSVLSGAEILDFWDNEIEGNKENVYQKHSLDITQQYNYNNMLLQDIGEKERFIYNQVTECLYYCPQCNFHLEFLAYTEITKDLDEINNGIGAYMNYYLKGNGGNPDSILVCKDITCTCGYKTTATFYKKFIEKEIPIIDIEELYIIDIKGARIEKDIDGVFTRDQCIDILSKLLIRWQVLYNQVFLAVPFIGFDYKNSEEQRVELWNWLLKHTIPSKTILITRKGTFNSFREGSKNQGYDIEILKSYGLLNPTLDGLSNKKSLFKQQFHAKFYAGYNKKDAEVLVGSFNIHEGGYVENIHYKTYEFGELFKRYILGLGIVFDPRKLGEEGEVLFLEIENNKLKTNKIEKYSESRKEIIDKIKNGN